MQSTQVTDFYLKILSFVPLAKKMVLRLLGPDPKAIELMGNKRLAKIEMLEAGVPCIPGYEGSEQSEDILFSESQKLGFQL